MYAKNMNFFLNLLLQIDKQMHFFHLYKNINMSAYEGGSIDE